MKYDVFNLYVVEIPNNDNSYYLICKYNNVNDTYIEIFTNEKIKFTKNLNVEPLSSYYQFLAIYNFQTNKTLKIDKKELLRKCIIINNRASLENENKVLKKTAIIDLKKQN